MELVKRLLAASSLDFECESSSDGARVTVSLGVGERRHAVTIRNVDGVVLLTAIVAGADRASPTSKRRRLSARLAWSRNAHSDFVTFGLDRRGRLVGRIRHPAEHLDLEELELYLKALASECDRAEALLTGLDRR